MIRRFLAFTLMAGLTVAALAVAATPAYAQMGSLTGKVVDESGKPVEAADVKLVFAGDLPLHFAVKTDKNGFWTCAGLNATGRWNVTVTKGDLSGGAPNVEIALGGAKPVPDIVLRKPGASATGLTRGEAKKILDDANTALAAKNYDAAIAKLTEATKKIDKCSECYVGLGDAYSSKNDYANAETAYKAAIEIDGTSANAYEGLAAIYNSQKKFDDAAKATSKAMELRAAGGGPVDPMSAFNAGVVFWNQGKIAEAKEQFSKAVQAKPDLADAQYYLGMCLVNEGKVPEAKTALETYLKLAPTGENAGTAKAILDSMK